MKPKDETFPPGLRNAFFFAAFNALSFQIVLSSPMILYAKTLGASTTVLGIIAGMMPLLVIFQIPAAQYVHRVGYKQFVYAGWGIRIMFIFGMAVVPLLSFLNASTRLALILLLLFSFNLSRGISSCAWFPWITSLIPPASRGKYLVIEAAAGNFSSFITILISAICLGTKPANWQFAILFVFSGIMGVASLSFLKRIPDAAMPEEISTSKEPIPWLEIANYRPFKKLLHVIVVWSLAYGGLTTFTVAFLKTEMGMAAGKILFLTSISFLGGLSSLWFLGSRMDHLGSKPILTFSFFTFILVLAGWWGLAGHILIPSLGFLLAIQFLMGLAAALVTMANTRLAMAIIPVMGRNHFFALYSVVGSLVLGTSPILWGLFLDSLVGFNVNFLGIEWHRYTIFFATVAIVYLIAIVLSRRLEEPEAASMEDLVREILVASPRRVWVRLWPRI